MEWVRELFATAVLAILLSFVVAKLVSVAMAGDDVRYPVAEPCEGADRVEVAGDVKFEARLSTQGSESEKGVEFVRDAAGKVDRFQQEVASMEETVEPVRCGEGIGTERGEAVGGSSVAVEFPTASKEEESVGALEVVVEKESECRSRGAKEDDDHLSLVGKVQESQPHVPESAGTAQADQPEHKQEQIDDRKEVFREGARDDDPDDDWEGIERSDLENKFAVAAKYVDPVNMDDRVESVGSDVKMQLYGLHKVATEGPCREPQPMALMVSARAKCDGGKCLRCARNAWQRLGNMSPDVAMERYISLLAENIPDWEVVKTTNENTDVAMPGAQDCNFSNISGDEVACTNLRETPMASVTGQIDPSKDENQ